MDARADPSSDDYRKVKAVIDQAFRDLASLGAEVVDPLVVPELTTVRTIENNFETERAMDDYLSEHANAPIGTLGEILLSGVVIPWRARGMMGSVGKTTEDPGYLEVIRKRETLRQSVLKVMADEALDVIVYATFDHQPTLIASDVETNPTPADEYGRGDNRGLSPAIGFPALTVPAGFHHRPATGRARVPGQALHGGDAARLRIRLRAGDATPPFAPDDARPGWRALERGQLAPDRPSWKAASAHPTFACQRLSPE